MIQALRNLGQRRVDVQMLAILRRRLTAADKRQILKDLRYVPVWIANILTKEAA